MTADHAVTALSAHRVRHPRITERLNDLSALMYPVSTDDIILVCGPSGVGKSTLSRFLVEDAVRGSQAAMNRDAGLVPAIYVEAPSSGEREFSWALLYQNILSQLEGELPMRRHAYSVDPATNRLSILPGLSPNSLAALRTAVERALRDRGTTHVVIDEAAHIMQHQNTRRLTANMNTLKSLSNRSGAQFVLSSSYDLFQMMSLSGQLARRTQVLHFDRYRQDNDSDVRAFRSCVQWFEKQLPELFAGRLLPYSEVLHDNALGCIGTLRDVLTRAARFMAAKGGWSPELLRRCLLTDAQHKRILEEILEGEEAINPGISHTAIRPRSPKKAA
ncbi:ATP-binding protein [Rubrivivax gelatinosus]|uniref:ATP-binding protein n=1 Tax=Rubrivivax gelatinosus TaxID=28068 RepID=UPI001E3D8D00|nr:ATP-binding protein [Rubrivivax gelatinosus]